MVIRDSDRTAAAAALAVSLSLFCVSPLIKPGWVATSLLAVLTVAVSGGLLRRVTDLWAWVAAGQLTSLWVVLTLWAGGVPGPGGVDLFSDLVRAGLDVTHDQSAPVDATAGVVVLTAGAVGLLALAVDVLSVSLRSPALGGFPLLVAYAMSVALVPGGVDWPRFAVPAAGFLVLLAVGSGGPRRSWGRTIEHTGSGVPARSTAESVAVLGRDGRRVGAAALALALVIPPLIPQLGEGLLWSGSGVGDGEGARVSVVNPILNLRQDLTSQSSDVIIRYTTNAPSPPPLRIVTDDVFDGSTWAPRRATLQSERKVQTGLSAPPGLAETTGRNARKATVEVDGLRQTYLPVPYPARRVDVDGTWLYDPETLNVVGVGTDTRDLRYTVDYLDVEPTAAQLEAAGPAPLELPGVYFSVPRDLPAVVAETAREVTGSATTAYGQAAALQAWFREGGGFTYTTDAPQVGSNDSGAASMAAFLQQKQGYCVHFASAMAMMARTLGIPARVAVGFLPGTRNGDAWEISLKDAHAWPELYFEGSGWVRFEPTPAARTGAAPGYSAPAAGTDTADTPAATAAPQPSASAGTAPQDRSQALDEDTTTRDAAGSGFSVPWWVFAALALLLVVLCLPAAAAALGHRSRARCAASPDSPAAELAWDDLGVRLADLGVGVDPAATPRTVQAELVETYRLGGSERAAAGRLVRDLEGAVFAPEGTASRPWPDARRDVATVVAGVAATRSGGVRWRARLVPASGLATLADLVGGADRAAGGVMDRAARRRAAIVRDLTHRK